MEKAILLAVAASLCTATSSVCQRKGARSSPVAGFDLRLVFRLAREPVWLLGIASMILGFVFQLTALRYGDLALIQPILAAELLFVFGYLALAGSRRVKLRDWLAAAAMSAGIGVFLCVASPSGGRTHAPGSWWLLAGLTTVGVVLLALAAAFGPGNHPGTSRRAAVLGCATGIAWGFMAAVIKELSSHLGDDLGAIFSTWSIYVLIAAGAATVLLASHALAAGPLAASQPGFTILDPLAASLLGVFLFGEHIRTGVLDLGAEALALTLVIVGAAALSRSCLITSENRHPSASTSPPRAAPPTHPRRPPAGPSEGPARNRQQRNHAGQGRSAGTRKSPPTGRLPIQPPSPRPGPDHPGPARNIAISNPNGPRPNDPSVRPTTASSLIGLPSISAGMCAFSPTSLLLSVMPVVAAGEP
jgi:drug/metabolite transporter (DMT)-like permease